MTKFYISYLLEDALGRRTRKTLETKDYAGVDAGADFLSAQAAAQTMAGYLQSFSELEVLNFKISYDEDHAGSLTSGANVDEGATLTLRKAGTTKRGTMKIPGPVQAIRNSDGTIDVTSTIVTNVVDQFKAANDFLFSDGENVDDTSPIVSGRVDK